MVKLITVTWSYEETFNIENSFLYKSFIKNNLKSNFIHFHYNRNHFSKLEEEYRLKYDYQYEYLLYKIYLTLPKLEKIDSDYLIFCDANDVVCLGDISKINISNKILMSSEINQYPSSTGDWEGLDYPEEDKKNKHFLNSGLFIARKDDYIELLKEIIKNIFPKNIKSLGGDQGAFTYHYLGKKTPEIILDKDCKLFLSTFNRDPNDFVNYDFPLFVHDNGFNWGSPKFIERFKLI